ncbi:MAG: dockerin type I repeat-containing protein [Oscillospiraceae bacterium]|jgi:hypothetical protein|nr:dockerin type I repeat-containing protein [Oscillospiraceae bacterium]
MKLQRKRFSSRALALLLAMLVLFSGALTAVASEDDASDEAALERAEVVTRFNTAVNRLKTDKPKFYFSSERGALVPKKQDGILGLIGDIISGIGGLVGGMTGNGSIKEIDEILGYLLVSSPEETEYLNLTKGENNKDVLPVKGQDYVSALTPDDEFTYEYKPYSFGGFEIKITLPDTFNPAEDSAFARLFDLPAIEDLYGKFYKITPDIDWSKVQVKYTNISLTCLVNQQEELVSYKTHYEASLAITNSANVDLSTIQFPESMFLGEVQIKNIDWTPRKLGDGDGDGYVYASDARMCLRISAKLVEVAEKDFPYYDVDKDGKITAADARLILRAAANLEALE